MQTDIFTSAEFNSFISPNKAAVIYFSTPDCNVCKVLKPKLIEFLTEEFPKIVFAYVDCEKAKELAAQNGIFSVPTILFFFEGKEMIRQSRNVNFSELWGDLNRIFSLMEE
jgi:thioredoxin-like negative regulator of GroEL